MNERAADCERVVMVVDDDHDLRETIAEVLEDNAFLPLCAANGQDALDKVKSAVTRPCVILLDIMMPVMDGWEFRNAQQADEALRSIPTVVLTAHADAADAAGRMEAAGWLEKPVHLEALLSTVRRFCD